jgi:hypothetical protein
MLFFDSQLLDVWLGWVIHGWLLEWFRFVLRFFPQFGDFVVYGLSFGVDVEEAY